MSAIELDPRLRLPAVTVKNEYASAISYSIGPQNEANPEAIETESVARAKD
jgi:hypothetical protein